MTFDKSRIYTAVNADEVKIGSKGYFATTLVELKSYVKTEISLDELDVILDDGCLFRFCSANTERSYALFYLVEEPKEKSYRPYKDTAEMADDYKRRFNQNVPNGQFPFMWFTHKEGGWSYLATGFNDIKVKVFNDNFTLNDLLYRFTYTDGSPCGKLEE